MACRLIGAKLLPEPMLAYCQLEFGNKFQCNLIQNDIIFLQENESENVCKMASILIGLSGLMQHWYGEINSTNYLQTLPLQQNKAKQNRLYI